MDAAADGGGEDVDAHHALEKDLVLEELRRAEEARVHALEEDRLAALRKADSARLSAHPTVLQVCDDDARPPPDLAVLLEQQQARDDHLLRTFKTAEEGRLEEHRATEAERLVLPSGQPVPAAPADNVAVVPTGVPTVAVDTEKERLLVTSTPPAAAAAATAVVVPTETPTVAVDAGADATHDTAKRKVTKQKASAADTKARAEARARAIFEKEAKEKAAAAEEAARQKAAKLAAKAEKAAADAKAQAEAEARTRADKEAARKAREQAEQEAREVAAAAIEAERMRVAQIKAAATAAAADGAAADMGTAPTHAPSSSAAGMQVALMDCVKCRRPIPEHVFFCGFCGAISLPPNLYKNATTAHEGAMPSSSLKPWRQPPKAAASAQKNQAAPPKRKKVKVKAEPSVTGNSVVNEAGAAAARPRAAVEVFSPNVIVIDGMTYVKLMPAGPVKAKAAPPEPTAVEDAADRVGDDGHGSGGDAGAVAPMPEPEPAAPAKADLLSPGQRTPAEVAAPSHPPPPTAQQLTKSIKFLATAQLKPLLQERVFPLAAFEAAWLQTSARTYAVHLSLVERKLSSRSQFWLRVGVVPTKVRTQHTPRSPLASIFDDDEPKDDEDGEEDLQVVGWLTNDVGRRLLPPGQEWVDLDSITPKEHYVLTYLQRVLTHVADRVRWDTAERSLVASHRYVDQFCVVRAGKAAKPASSRFVRIEMVEEPYDVERLQHLSGTYAPRSLEAPAGDATVAAAAGAAVLPQASTVDGDADDAIDEDDVATAPAAAAASAALPPSALMLDDTIVQVTCRIPLGRRAGAPRVISTVRLSVVYFGCCPLRTLPEAAEQGLAELASPGARGNEDNDFINPAEKAKPLPTAAAAVAGAAFGMSKFEGSDVLLARPQILHTPKASHVKLLITPSYAPTKIGQKMLIFDVATLPYLIGPVDVDAVLTHKVDLLVDFVRSLCGVLRYEHFETDAVKLVVVGATMLPEALYQPRAEPVAPVEDEEDAVLVLPVVPVPAAADADAERDAAAAAAAAAVAAAAAAAAEAAANKAATRVQALTRGMSSRNRVRQLREQLQGQEEPTAETEAEADLPVEASPEGGDSSATSNIEETPVPASTAASPLEVDKVIKGTELRIVGEFIPDSMYGDGAKNLSLQLTAADVQDGLRTTATVGASHVLLAARKLYGESEEFKSLVVAPQSAPVSDPVDDATGGEWAQFSSNFPAALAADAALQRLVFLAVCDNLDLFLSRKNNVMTVKYMV